MFTFVILVFQLEIARASDPFPLSNIMLEGIGSRNPLQCAAKAAIVTMFFPRVDFNAKISVPCFGVVKKIQLLSCINIIQI